MENYQEIQKFRQWWLWAILLLIPVLIIILEYSEAKTFVIGSLTATFVFLPFILYFYFLNLKTSIDKNGISLTFRPFLLNYKMIKFEDIATIKPVTFVPITESGGWGLRFYKSGTAYTVSGNQGIEILLKNNDLILIGTQKPKEFMASYQSLSLIY